MNKDNISMKNNERKTYLDIVKIIAIYLVLFTHTGIEGNQLYKLANNNFQRLFYLIPSCFRHINIALLFMASGALLLGKNETIKVVLGKRVLRYFVVLFIFSFAWIFYSEGGVSQGLLVNIKRIISEPVNGKYWFLYTYISFLLMLPFLRSMAKHMSDKNFCYLVVLSIISESGSHVVKRIFRMDSINFTVFSSLMYVWAPLAGFYLDQKLGKLKDNFKFPVIKVLISGCVSLLLAAGFSLNYFSVSGEWRDYYNDILYQIVAIAVFILVYIATEYIRNHLSNEHFARFQVIVAEMSGTVFGIYLMEDYLKKSIRPLFELLRSYLPPLMACMLWLVCVMFLGIVVVGILRKLPGVKKFI